MARGVGALLLVAAAALLTDCQSARHPPPPRPRPLSPRPDRRPQARELGPYLEAYPLGGRGSRVDLLGFDEERSLHLLQAQRVVPSHRHRAHRTRIYVMTGQGTVYVEDRSYPARSGSTFVLEPGVVHSLHPDEGFTLVAVAYHEPPLADGQDWELVDTSR